MYHQIGGTRQEPLWSTSPSRLEEKRKGKRELGKVPTYLTYHPKIKAYVRNPKAPSSYIYSFLSTSTPHAVANSSFPSPTSVVFQPCLPLPR